MPLDEKDRDELQHALLDLHEERDLEEFRLASPAIVMKAIPCEHFIWMESLMVSPAEPLRNTMLWEQPKRMKPKHVSRLDELAVQHPFMRHARATGDWGPFRLSDFWSDDELKASAHWAAAYRELRTGRLLSGAAFRGNRIGTINLSRPLESADFSERDRAVLKRLAPHYHQALHAAERVTTHRDREAHPLASLGLSSREADVAVWLARGRTNSEIASILALQPRTVEKHVERMLSKLGVENRTEAALLISGAAVLKERPAPGPERPAHAKAARPKARARRSSTR